MKRLIASLALVLLALLPSLTWAGSSEGGEQHLPPHEVAAFTDALQHDLAARGANVAIVARVGRDRESLPHGIEYTHVAYWVFSKITRKDGSSYTGYRAYNLYQQADDKTVSRLIEDGPADFFAGAYELDAGVVVPDPRLQRKLLDVIASPVYSDLHNASYSVLANPADPRFQNCTEHTLDVLMASLYGTGDKVRIKANIAAHFDPQIVRINGVKRLLAPAASAALTTADHGSEITTATFGSIARFMAAHGLSQHIYRFTSDGAQSF